MYLPFLPLTTVPGPPFLWHCVPALLGSYALPSPNAVREMPRTLVPAAAPFRFLLIEAGINRLQERLVGYLSAAVSTGVAAVTGHRPPRGRITIDRPRGAHRPAAASQRTAGHSSAQSG